MKNWKYILLPAYAVFCPAWSLHSQNVPDSTILSVTGASCMEELSGCSLEELEMLYHHPLNINTAPRSKMEASGLFSSFQLQSLIEYRDKSGDILSPAEMVLLDGFDEAYVRSIAPFLDFSSRVAAGGSSLERRIRADAQARLKWRGDESQFRSKFRFEREGLFSAGITTNKRYNLTLYGQGRMNGKITLGDYSARFGQGLVLWTGFSLSGFSSPDSFFKRSSGVASSWSYSSATARGLAVSCETGKTEISVMGSFAGDKFYAANANRVFRNGSAGVTALCTQDGMVLCSSDMSVSIGDILAFAELSTDFGNKCVAAIAGMLYNFDYQKNVAVLWRFYPVNYNSSFAGAVKTSSKCSDERGVSAAARYKSKTLSFDASYHPKSGSKQFKTTGNFPFKLSEVLSLSLKAGDRYKPADKHPHRSEMRADLKYEKSGWMALFRVDIVHMRDWAKLAYLELGYTWARGYAYLRGTVYDVRNWDDRIYSYERDAPGNFNVPAYYGKGYSVSMTGRFTINKRNKLYLRLSEKELAFQYVFSY